MTTDMMDVKIAMTIDAGFTAVIIIIIIHHHRVKNLATCLPEPCIDL